MPPLENLSSKVLPDFVGETLEDDKQGGAVEQNGSNVNEQSQGRSLVDTLVESKTGFKFPVLLTSDDQVSGSGTQVLAGVGVRSINIIKIKEIKIYAFGFYINPEHMRAQLGDKYGKIPPQELKLKSVYYEDLLRHDLEMTVRLVVHYKRLKIGMVRSAFESSLKNRLRKLKRVDDDEGLHIFCSYFTEDLSLPPGTVIDFHWRRGGQFETKVHGRLMGTIFSLDFCRAFFDLYIGDPPVCSKAKHDIGMTIGQMLQDS